MHIEGAYGQHMDYASHARNRWIDRYRIRSNMYSYTARTMHMRDIDYQLSSDGWSMHSPILILILIRILHLALLLSSLVCSLSPSLSYSMLLLLLSLPPLVILCPMDG